MSWRYRLALPYRHGSMHLAGVSYRNDWIDLSHGVIGIRAGYAWDGCSPAWRLPGGIWLGTPDGPLGIDGRPLAYHASLVHDALCQWAVEIPIEQRATVALFETMLVEGGFPRWRAALYARAVERFGPRRFGGDPVPVHSV